QQHQAGRLVGGRGQFREVDHGVVSSGLRARATLARSNTRRVGSPLCPPGSRGLRTPATLLRSKTRCVGSLLCPPGSRGLRTRATLLRSKTRCVGSLLYPPGSRGLRARATLLRSKTRCVGSLLCPPAEGSLLCPPGSRGLRARATLRGQGVSGHGEMLGKVGQDGKKKTPLNNRNGRTAGPEQRRGRINPPQCTQSGQCGKKKTEKS